jgi:hypothetical protein
MATLILITVLATVAQCLRDGQKPREKAGVPESSVLQTGCAQHVKF